MQGLHRAPLTSLKLGQLSQFKDLPGRTLGDSLSAFQTPRRAILQFRSLALSALRYSHLYEDSELSTMILHLSPPSHLNQSHQFLPLIPALYSPKTRTFVTYPLTLPIHMCHRLVTKHFMQIAVD